jgi:hypothetical protein
MRLPLLCVLILFICVSPFSQAGFSLAESGGVGGDGSDAFVDAWMTAQRAEKDEQAHHYKDALSKFRQAARKLDKISKKYPKWSPMIVKYRKDRTAEAIARVQGELTSGRPARGSETPGIPWPETQLVPLAEPEYR